MRLAMEIPKALLQSLSPLCDIDFALAHLVLEDQEYREYYADCTKRQRFVILDNGFHELGKPLDVTDLVHAASLISPSVVVAPDRLGDQRFGLEQFFDLQRLLPSNFGLACVLCGRGPAERAEMFMKVAKYCEMLCLPFKEARFEWYCDLRLKIPRYIQWPPRLHLLGVSELWELKAFRERFDDDGIESRRTSVDTSKPVKLGLQGKRISTDMPSLRNLGSLDHGVAKPAADRLADILYNVGMLRKYM